MYIALPALSVFGFPFVAAISSMSGASSTVLSISVRFLVLVICIFIFFRLRIAKQVRLERMIFWTSCAFWILYLVRLGFFTVFQQGIIKYEPYYYWVWAIGTCFFPMMAIFLCSNKINVRKLFIIFYVLIVLTLLLALPNARTGVVVDGVMVDRGRLQLESLNPISLGRLGACLVIISVWSLVCGRKEASSLLSILFRLLAVILGLAVLIYSGSRGPMLSLASGVLFLSLALQSVNKIKLTLVIFLTGCALYIAFPYMSIDLIDKSVVRISNALSGSDAATQGRFNSYQGALEVFRANPLFGGLLEEPNTNFYPHNILLESLMSTGVLGFVFLFSAMLIGVYTSFALMRERSNSSWIGLLFIIYLVQAQFSGSIYKSYELWTMLALTAVGARSLKNSTIGSRRFR